MDKLILNSINSLIPKLNNNWAEVVGKRMSKSPQTVRAYARGERGTKSGKQIALLAQLQKLLVQTNNEIEEIIHFNPENPTQRQQTEYSTLKQEATF